MSAPTRVDHTVTDTLGKWRLEAWLGSGGMGDVYLARDPDGRAAALKIVRPELAADPGFRARFRREVAVSQRAGGPGLARFLDADVDGAEPWLATEYVRGPTLADHVDARGPLEGRPLAALATALAEALARIHGAGVIHRDLKPANVILTVQRPVVVDFGIAAVLSDVDLTAAGMVVGSPGWLAPEQVRGDEVGPAADVFSWAGTVAFAASGQPPFGHGRPDVLLYRVVHDQPDLAGLRDPMLRRLVVAALDKDPSRRPTVAGLLAALSRRAGDDATRAVASTWVGPPPAPPVVAVAAAPKRRRRAWLLAAAVAAVTMVGAGGAFAVTRQGSAGGGAAAGTATATTAPATTVPATTVPVTTVPVTTTVPPTTTRPAPTTAAVPDHAAPTTAVVAAPAGQPAAAMPTRISGYRPSGPVQSERVTLFGGTTSSPSSFRRQSSHCSDGLWTARWRTVDADARVVSGPQSSDDGWFDDLFGSPHGTAAAAGYLSGSLCDRPAFVWDDGHWWDSTDVTVEWQYWRASS